MERIIARGESLTAHPERGHPPRELRPIGDRIWLEILEPPWRILYRILDKGVEIHGVLDGRRSLAEILLERILHA